LKFLFQLLRLKRLHPIQRIIQDHIDTGNHTTAQSRVTIIRPYSSFEVKVDTAAQTIGNSDCFVGIADGIETDY